MEPKSPPVLHYINFYSLARELSFPIKWREPNVKHTLAHLKKLSTSVKIK